MKVNWTGVVTASVVVAIAGVGCSLQTGSNRPIELTEEEAKAGVYHWVTYCASLQLYDNEGAQSAALSDLRYKYPQYNPEKLDKVRQAFLLDCESMKANPKYQLPEGY